MTYCEDYPCCGHTPSDPCDARSMVDEPWYCDQCGFNHAGFMVSCPADEEEEEYDYEDEDPTPFILADNEAYLDQMEFDMGMETRGWEDSY